MGKIYSIEEIPEGENIYLKKDFFGWRVVEPIKDPKTGNVNKFNLITGGKRSLAVNIIYIVIALLIYAGVNELIDGYKDVAANPCNYCKVAQALNEQVADSLRLSRTPNLTELFGENYTGNNSGG